MAARSTAPVLGAVCSSSNAEGATSSSDDEGGPLSLHHWSYSIQYRHQYSHRHFVGTTEQVQRQQQGTEVVNSINLFNVALTYDFNPRWSMTLTMPVLNTTRTYDHQLFQTLLKIPGAPDQVSNSNGIGDMGVSAQFWLLRPPAESGRNIAFSFGAVFPTGNCAATDTVQTVNGSQSVYVDQSIQPGTCGYGITLGTQAYQRVKRSVFFVSGSYELTPQEQNGTPNKSLAGLNRPVNPLTQFMSIPDQYLVDGGIARPFPKVRGLAYTGALRYEGVKVKDLIGGSLGFRRPGYALSAEPGFQYQRAKNIWTFSLPVAIQRNRKRSVPDQIQGTAGDAAFADYFFLFGYQHHF